MKDRKIVVKVIFTVLIAVILTVNFGNIYGEINTSYAEGAQHVTGQDVINSAEDNILLSPISYLVYFVGILGEWLLTGVSMLTTGSKTVPWADLIVFNAVPVLDINFINPSSGTLMEKYLSGVVQNIYFTVLSLAIAFFGLVVLVMAIKILTSAIAADKAKYKEAIMNWVIGIALLFTIHYLISFIFYLNESMVRVASSIATTTIGYDKDNPNTDEDKKISTFAGLAEYFKTQSDNNAGNAAVSRIMYTIFVAQTVLLFFAYIKRLFYVIILSIMAPIIVVYDFFAKSIA